MHVLPKRKLSAAANMAVDELLLTEYPTTDQPRFRHYEWSSHAFTFGRTQSYAEAEQALPIHASWREAHDHFSDRIALIRRTTGGGVVDHRDDWTYSLVIPIAHPLARAKAGDGYREVHNILAWALRAQEVDASLAPCHCGDTPQPRKMARVCFQRAEPADVVDADGQKLAGAAQRRTRDGLLIQGSIHRSSIRAVNWTRFENNFAGALAEWLGGATNSQPFPKWKAEQLATRIAHYESDAWNRRR